MKMQKKNDKTGKRFGRLLVISPAHFLGVQRYWLCRCDCGAVKPVQGGNLASGNVRSCGCLMKERSSLRAKTHGESRREGNKPTVTYRSWASMKQRCRDPNKDNFDRYGGRGITVCDRWLSFENFVADMGERPSTDYSLERIDNDRGYEPGNVRWATSKEQQRNTSYNRLIIFNGVTTNVTDAAAAASLPRNAVFKRLDMGWSVDRALTTPLAIKRRSKRAAS